MLETVRSVGASTNGHLMTVFLLAHVSAKGVRGIMSLASHTLIAVFVYIFTQTFYDIQSLNYTYTCKCNVLFCLLLQSCLTTTTTSTSILQFLEGEKICFFSLTHCGLFCAKCKVLPQHIAHGTKHSALSKTLDHASRTAHPTRSTRSACFTIVLIGNFGSDKALCENPAYRTDLNPLCPHLLLLLFT